MIVQADARQIPLPDNSVHCCVTSPPYWGLRDYGLEPSVWDDPGGCGHEWREHIEPAAEGSLLRSGNSAARAGHQGTIAATMYPKISAFCSLCGAWRGTLGLEPTVELYVKHLVEIFREVRRVLHPSGLCFLNLGDSYCGSGDGGGGNRKNAVTWFHDRPTQNLASRSNLKPKDLCMIPFRVALALQADGWWLRSVIPWVKRNAMPESVTDRPTSAVEYIFMLAKSERYFYDAEAVKVAAQNRGDADESKLIRSTRDVPRNGGLGRFSRGGGSETGFGSFATRSRRNSDWCLESFNGLLVDEYGGPLAMLVNPQPWSGSHFATFPEAMVEPCLRAGASERGVCRKCGAQWIRQTEKPKIRPKDYEGRWLSADPNDNGRRMLANVRARREAGEPHDNPFPAAQTIGWRSTCSCGTDTVPALVLDCFSGSGTVGVVAERLGLRFVGLDLKWEYVKMAVARISDAAKTDRDREIENLERAGQMPLWSAVSLQG